MNHHSILSDLDSKILTGIRLEAFDDRLGQKLLGLYRKGVLDPWTVGQINNRVDKQLRKEAFLDIPFKKPRLHTGQLIIGSDTEHALIKCPTQYFNAGTLLVANTGSGKTTLVCFYAIQMVNLVKGMWLVDLRKREFRLLQSAFKKQGIDLCIVRSRKFKINPLQVPYQVDPYEYASTIADMLVKVLNIPPRASVLLSSVIIRLYKTFHVFNGSQRYPTLFHLFEAVRLDRNANPQARQAILDNLEAILLAFGTEVLGYYRSWPIHELARHHMVFELAGQPEAGKDLILNYLVAAEFISRIGQGISNPGMDLWMVTDEGQRMFSQSKESAGYGGNSITDLAGLVRGTGAGLFVSVLTPDDLSNKIPSITSTKIMGRCGSILEYKAAGQFMGLSTEEITWCAHHMVPGMFVGQVAEGNWRYPFLFRVPKMNALGSVTNAEADESLKVLEKLDTEPVEFSNWSAVECITVKDAGVDNEHKSVKDQTTVQLTDGELRILKSIVENPMMPSSSYVKLARVSPNTLANVRPLLIEKGLIKEHLMDAGVRGRSKRLWEPLESAKQMVAVYFNQQAT